MAMSPMSELVVTARAVSDADGGNNGGGHRGGGLEAIASTAGILGGGGVFGDGGNQQGTSNYHYNNIARASGTNQQGVSFPALPSRLLTRRPDEALGERSHNERLHGSSNTGGSRVRHRHKKFTSPYANVKNDDSEESDSDVVALPKVPNTYASSPSATVYRHALGTSLVDGGKSAAAHLKIDGESAANPVGAAAADDGGGGGGGGGGDECQGDTDSWRDFIRQELLRDARTRIFGNTRNPQGRNASNVGTVAIV